MFKGVIKYVNDVDSLMLFVFILIGVSTYPLYNLTKILILIVKAQQISLCLIIDKYPIRIVLGIISLDIITMNISLINCQCTWENINLFNFDEMKSGYLKTIYWTRNINQNIFHRILFGKSLDAAILSESFYILLG